MKTFMFMAWVMDIVGLFLHHLHIALLNKTGRKHFSSHIGGGFSLESIRMAFRDLWAIFWAFLIMGACRACRVDGRRHIIFSFHCLVIRPWSSVFTSCLPSTIQRSDSGGVIYVFVTHEDEDGETATGEEIRVCA